MQNQASAVSPRPSVRGARSSSQALRTARRWCVCVCVAAAFGALAQLLLWGLGGHSAVTAAVVIPSGIRSSLTAGKTAHDYRSLFDYRVAGGLDWLHNRFVTTASTFNTIIVNDPNDNATAGDMKCTLREALNNANQVAGGDTTGGDCASGTTGLDTIRFALGGGTPVINATTGLPPITEPINLDGNNPAQRVRIDGAATSGWSGLTLLNGADGSTVKSLVITRFGHGIAVINAGNNMIRDCYLGTDAAGTPDLGNQVGLSLNQNSDGNVIGGTTTADRNVISGNSAHGIWLLGDTFGVPENNLIQGNYIGTNPAGTAARGNVFGIFLQANGAGIPNNTIGGAAAGAGNLIAGNGGPGILILGDGSNNNKIWGNAIGTDMSGSLNMGNASNGIAIGNGAKNNQVGGVNAGEGNRIAFNGRNGVAVSGATATGNAIQGNVIHSNGSQQFGDTPGIDLEDNQIVNGNDNGDADTGGNNLQNYPVLASVTSGGLVIGTFNSTPNRSFRIEYFKNSTCDSSGYGEGEVFLDAQEVTTDGSGDAPLSFSFAYDSAKPFVTATATDLTTGDTSEFSACVRFCPALTVISAPTTLPGTATLGAPYPTVTFNGSGGAGPYSFSYSGTLPTGLNLVGATLAGTPSAAGMFNFTVQATDANGCVGTQAYSIAVNCPAYTITPATLPNGTANVAYDQQLTASGGAGGPYQFGFVSGLPPNMFITTAGRLLGTPTTAGTYNLSVPVFETISCITSQPYTLTINPPACPTITVSPTTPFAFGIVGTAYTSTFISVSASPTATYNFAVSVGGLPPELELIQVSGSWRISHRSGMPLLATPGKYDFTLRATNAATGCFGERAYTLVVHAATPTIIVNTADDENGTGPNCSLREAITAANSNAPYGGCVAGQTGYDKIGFAAPYSIALTAGLPGPSEPLFIDGLAGSARVELNGASAATTQGLLIESGYNYIKSLVINRVLGGNAINISGTNAIRNGIEDCRLGTDTSGTVALPNGGGIGVFNAGPGNGIGRTTGPNLISGNSGTAVNIFDSPGTSVTGNLIGLQADGLTPLGNGGSGVSVRNTLTPIAPIFVTIIQGNRIAYNATGINVADTVPGQRTNLFSNSIFNNTGLGIDLGNDGVTLNDPGDADTGTNRLMNFPVLNSITPTATGGTVNATLDIATGNAAFNVSVQFFASSSCDPSGYGEGESLLGTVNGITAASVASGFTFNYTTAQVFGKPFITAVTTDAQGNSSEFSQCRAVPNDLPTITAAAPLSLTQGASTTGQNIATVNDLNQAANTLTVAATPLTGSGVTLSGIAIDANGQVTANVSATCAAATSTFTLTVTDQQNATATATLTVNVTPATPVSATPLGNAAVTEGQTATLTTTASGTGPFSFVWKKGATVITSGGRFTIAGTANTNTLTINPAQLGDVGTYSVEVSGLCPPAAMQSATLTVTPSNTPPTLSGATLSVRQGDAVALRQIGTAGDAQQAADTLTFHISNGGVLNGVHVNFTQIQATGEVMANVVADCNATNATFTIGVSDTQNALTSVPLTINVLPNQPPGLSYNSATVLLGSSNSLNPASGPSDVSYTLGLQSVTPNSFTGTFNVLPSGVVQVNNAGPLGTYQVVIRATDNCGLHTDAAFTLTVVNTTGGPNVTPPLPPGSPQVTFSNVVTPGNTTVTPIPPNDAGAMPSGFSLPGLNVAFEIATTAVFNGPVVLTFDVPSAVDPAVFDKLRVLHKEGGVLVDRTILPPNQPAPHFQTRKISALVSSFSPFVVAGVITTPTVTVAAAPVSTTVGQAANFTATVLSNSLPVLQGSLTFKEGATVLAGPLPLDASGQAGFNTSALTVGTHTITAEYNGAGLFNPASGNTLHSVGCPAITLANLPAATAGVAYSQTLSATPVGGNYSFTLTGGALPPGLNFNNGVLSGTPTQTGSFSFTLTATGFGTCAQARSYSFTVNCPTVSVSPNSLPNGVVGSVYSPRSLSAAPVGTTYGYAVTQGQLPPGLTLNNGVISGTPIAPGNFSFTITATGFGACTGARTFTILVTGTCNPITVQPASLAGGTTGVAYYQKLSATGGAEPYTFSVSTGVLPAGLTLNPASGEITGAPLQGGVVAFTIRATSAGGCNSTRSYVMSIVCGTLNWSPEALPPGRVREAYSQQLNVNPASNATFSLLLGSLPAGLSLSSSGLINGITNNGGTFSFTVKAVAGPCQSTKAYTLVLNNQQAVRNDYDGDGKSDLVNWNEKDGRWLIVNSHDGALQNFVFGAPGDISASGDFDGDGRWDAAVFRPGDGVWYVRLSNTGQHQTKLWGTAGDTPVPGDYDGDGKTDFAVWRGAEGRWYIWRSSDGVPQNEAWGTANSPYLDVPVPGDYDGDGKGDLAVFRRGSGTWLIKRSGAGTTQAQAWGLGTDTPVAADYDGDGRTDIAVWRGSEGVWYVLRSADNSTLVKAWGSQLPPYFDVPAPGDYDGDGQADLTVCRQGKTWYIVKSADGTTATRQLP